MKKDKTPRQADHDLSVEDILSEIEKIRNDAAILKSPQDLEGLEQKLQVLTSQLTAAVVEKRVQESLESGQLQSEGLGLVKKTSP